MSWGRELSVSSAIGQVSGQSFAFSVCVCIMHYTFLKQVTYDFAESEASIFSPHLESSIKNGQFTCLLLSQT